MPAPGYWQWQPARACQWGLGRAPASGCPLRAAAGGPRRMRDRRTTPIEVRGDQWRQPRLLALTGALVTVAGLRRLRLGGTPGGPGAGGDDGGAAGPRRRMRKLKSRGRCQAAVVLSTPGGAGGGIGGRGGAALSARNARLYLPASRPEAASGQLGPQIWAMTLPFKSGMGLWPRRIGVRGRARRGLSRAWPRWHSAFKRRPSAPT